MKQENNHNHVGIRVSVASDPECGGSEIVHAVPSTVTTAVDWVRGDPGPFCLFCFGMTTLMLTWIDMEWAEKKFDRFVLAYAFAFGGMGQLIGGLLQLIKGRTFGGTVCASYGCFWIGWGILTILPKYDPQLYPAAETGTTLWCGLWSILTFLFFLISLRKNAAICSVLCTLWIGFALLAGGVWSEDCKIAAGYVCFICASLAMYTGFAELVQEELKVNMPGLSAIRWI